MEIIDNKYRYDNEPDRIDSQKSIHLSEKTIGRSEIVHMIGLGALALGVMIAGAALGAVITAAVIIITKIALTAVPLILGGALVGAVLMIPVAALVIIVSNKYFVIGASSTLECAKIISIQSKGSISNMIRFFSISIPISQVEIADMKKVFSCLIVNTQGQT